jgi:hypothetical protein
MFHESAAFMHRWADWFCSSIAISGTKDDSIISHWWFSVSSCFSLIIMVNSNGESESSCSACFVLGLRFAHSLGLLHDHLTQNNVLFGELE